MNPHREPAVHTQEVLEQVRDERRNQRAQRGNPHDDTEGYAMLAGEAGSRAFTASQAAVPADVARKLLVQTAALAVAAIETLDREAAR